MAGTERMARLRWSSEEGNYALPRYWWVLVIGVLGLSLISPRPSPALMIPVLGLVIVVTVYLEWRRLTRR